MELKKAILSSDLNVLKDLLQNKSDLLDKPTKQFILNKLLLLKDFVFDVVKDGKKDFTCAVPKYLKLCKQNPELTIDGIFNIVDYVTFKDPDLSLLNKVARTFTSIPHCKLFYEMYLECYKNKIKDVEEYNNMVSAYLKIIRATRKYKILANSNWYKKSYTPLNNIQVGEITENFFENLNNDGSKENTTKNLYQFIHTFADVVDEYDYKPLRFDIEKLIMDSFKEIEFRDCLEDYRIDTFDELTNYVAEPIKISVKKLFDNKPYMLKGLISQVKHSDVVEKNLRSYKTGSGEFNLNDNFHYILNDNRVYSLSKNR